MVKNHNTILVSDETRKLLKEIGRKGETYDKIIRQLLDFRIQNFNPIERY